MDSRGSSCLTFPKRQSRGPDCEPRGFWLKNACCCCAPSQMPLGGARRPPHREAQAFGRPWLEWRGLALRPSEGCRKKLPAAAQWSYSLKQRGLRGQWGSHGYQEAWKGQGEEGPEGMACISRDRGSPPDFPQSWRGEEDPWSFSLSLARQPLRIYGLCSEATGINKYSGVLESDVSTGIKNPRACQRLSICLFFSQDL